MKKLLIAAAALCTLGFATSASAARAPDLEVTMSGPASVHVYEDGTYQVVVRNNGTRNANSVELQVMFPLTNNSPAAWTMGTITGWSSQCIPKDYYLTCSLGRIRKNRSKTITFDWNAPLSTAPIVFTADASSNRADANPADNVHDFTASPLTYDFTVPANYAVTNHHCTGQNLTSFHECAVSPSSISSFQSVLEVGGNIAILPASPPGFVGQWSQTGPDSIRIEYYRNGQLSAEMDAYGVGGGCFEGAMTFPISPGWVAMYEICP